MTPLTFPTSREVIFRNREEAAHLLAKTLSPSAGDHPLILGIPRGGVPMAATIAATLHGDLDVVLVHKIGAPMQPELAIGAVDESGAIHISHIADDIGISHPDIEELARKQHHVLKKRRHDYTPDQRPINSAGRIVIIVDDGSATGETMSAALRSIRMNKPSKLIAAMAVAPPETVHDLENLADEVVCLQTPLSFAAVGQFFGDFSPVEDKEVIKLLKSFPHSPAVE